MMKPRDKKIYTKNLYTGSKLDYFRKINRAIFSPNPFDSHPYILIELESKTTKRNTRNKIKEEKKEKRRDRK